MQRLKIAVVAGGDSAEDVISMHSATQVYQSLDQSLYEPYIVVMKGADWSVDCMKVDRNDFSFTTSDGQKIVFEYALIMIHGTPGENGILQGYFELMRIPYSTCNVTTSAVTFDKALCKMALRADKDITMAREIILDRNSTIDTPYIIEQLGLPVFVKPNASGSSLGVSKVKRAEDLTAAIAIAFEQSDRVLIEEYIEGREVSCGMMVTQGREWVLPVTELISKNEFFDFEAKYTDGVTNEVTPAEMPAETIEQLNSATRAIYRTLGCRGVVRIDYIIKNGTPYFIEVNTTPGMSANSIIPQQWRAAGLTMGEAFTMIINDTKNL